ncbi:hypothetical protein DIURU_002059 [Diutina rugosa]|uniref:candidapepsin n=1 Tax=Diutina rugosa TaxID=5481 RepID=A0A642UYB9_DIURU|nr:uncharacterized protein DIURU_002059 [Diutina rugosa]KAA8904107.1 hypothetical protein DIURU_002059 [Diutina rugosa]
MVSFVYSFMISLAAALVVRDQAPQPLELTLNKVPNLEAVQPNPRNRAKPGPQDVELFAAAASYQIDLGVINEDQKVRVVLDTGSADLWVDAEKLSNTNGFTKTGESFAIGYGDRSTTRGDFGKSSVFLENGLEVKDFQWALATEVTLTGGSQNGILGIGKVTNEAGYHRTGKTYPNFTQKLKDQGTITSNSYSYFLNKDHDHDGTITFGGRDNKKVKGPVATFHPSESDEYSRFDTVTVAKFTTSDGKTVQGFEAALDTGTTLTYIPISTLRELAIPGVYTNWQGQYYVDCNQPTDKYVSFWFNDVEIKLSYKDLAVPAYTINNQPSGTCFFAFQATGGENLLGDSFLRHAYITVNHDKNEILVSNVEYTDEKDIVAI